LLVGVALTCIAAGGFHARGFAQQSPAEVKGEASSKESEVATNTALLNALLKRRAEIVQAGSTPESHPFAFELLDTRIARLRSEIRRLRGF
jgi:hypothetical protein